MIDYVKIELFQEVNSFEENPLLEKVREFNDATGEVIGNHFTAILNGIRFRFYDSGRIFIDGSLHKFKNKGIHNYDDYFFFQFLATVVKLEEDFGINIGHARLLNLEYGVNIIPPIPSKKIIEGLMFYKTTRFKDIHLAQPGRFKRVDLQRFSIKVYDKGAQYQELDHELLRVEIQVKKMAYFNKIEIETLADLLDKDKLRRLGLDLISKWSSLLFFDPTIFENEYSYQDENLKWSNPHYWKQYRYIYSNSRKYISKEIENFEEYSLKYGKGTKSAVGNLIETKWNVLCHISPPKTIN